MSRRKLRKWRALSFRGRVGEVGIVIEESGGVWSGEEEECEVRPR